ncbi:hypothetical protein ACMSDZ_18610 [Bacteroides thetaiotaomicron]|uniref:hypothetical protein n=1 Tax=Bacteroides thetaiotaomicron TaxID=818 RepID=UPI0039C13C44
MHGVWPRMTVSTALSSPQSTSSVPVPDTLHSAETNAGGSRKAAVNGPVKYLG